jgi:hypothetical protein
MSMSKAHDDVFEPLEVSTHRDMARNIREISRRFNARPEIGRLVFVNAVLALEDVGVVLNAEMRQHVMNSLRFPKKLQRKLKTLEAELKTELPKLTGRPVELPLSDRARAELLFKTLKCKPRVQDGCQTTEISSRRARAYRKVHPLIEKLSQWERGRQGALVFQPRAVYEEFKRGDKHVAWLSSIRFKE